MDIDPFLGLVIRESIVDKTPMASGDVGKLSVVGRYCLQSAHLTPIRKAVRGIARFRHYNLVVPLEQNQLGGPRPID